MPTPLVVPPGQIPQLDISGTPFEAGEQLGHAWRLALRDAATRAHDRRPWWLAYPKLAETYTPHLPDLYRGMARSAGLREDQIGDFVEADTGGCTSFAIHPSATLEGVPICGQTKDTPIDRCFLYQVLRLNLEGAPSALTATYPGWLFGHGFVDGGCAIFRNAIFAPDPGGGLPYLLWGLLALHCRSVEDVIKLTHDHGISQSFHCTVQDTNGEIIGLESAKGGIDILTAEDGIYTHANSIRRNAAMQAQETSDEHFSVPNARFREARLRELLVTDTGRLTPQLAFRAMGDHDHYPQSICRHQSTEACTTAAIVAEPACGRLTLCRGPACQNWPVTYEL